MTKDPADNSNIVQFPGLAGLEQGDNPHRGVIATLSHIIRQMSDLVNDVNASSITDADKAKYAGWICSASALCLRAQLEYFQQFMGDGVVDPDASPDEPGMPPRTST